jgi:hypothetical protein
LRNGGWLIGHASHDTLDCNDDWTGR